jgi:hypothetical protein
MPATFTVPDFSSTSTYTTFHSEPYTSEIIISIIVDTPVLFNNILFPQWKHPNLPHKQNILKNLNPLNNQPTLPINLLISPKIPSAHLHLHKTIRIKLLPRRHHPHPLPTLSPRTRGWEGGSHPVCVPVKFTRITTVFSLSSTTILLRTIS